MAIKDNFSFQAKQYALFRPEYPQELYDFIFSMVPEKINAWDCATGNGQAARILSNEFQNVFATDISQKQLDSAHILSNIYYSISLAEKTNFYDNFFDLITVAQTLHWFNFEEFNNEVCRVGKSGCIVAVWGYGLLYISELIDEVIYRFYSQTIGPYWDDERKYIDDKYEGIPFPFRKIESPKFEIKVNWDLDRLIKYLETWSSVQKFIKQNGFNPIKDLEEELQMVWGEDKIKTITFPLFLKVGKVEKSNSDEK